MKTEIIEKIKKCLEMGKRGGTEAEMSVALGKVHELLAKHNLSLSEVENSFDDDETQKDDDTITFGHDKDARMIYNAMSELYFTYYFISTIKVNNKRATKHHLVGTLSNITTTKLMTEYVLDTLKTLTKYMNTDSRKSFSLGFCSRIHARVKDLIKLAKTNQLKDELENALILSPMYDKARNDNSLYMKNSSIRTTRSFARNSIKDVSAYNSGSLAANSVSLNNQLSSKQSVKLL